MDTSLLEINQHYAPGNISASISAALTALYNDTGRSIEDLAGLDQFHTGGIEATRQLAEQAAITASDRVLDVGGGLGGAARLLAHEIGCHVMVLDLTEAYCAIGEELTEEANLTHRVRFQYGNALDMPFVSESFDVVWTQHSSMNIADKARLYAEIRRVLRPGGKLALFEVSAGSGKSIHLPAPWAHTEAMNFLVSPVTFHDTVIQAGFRELVWLDRTDWSMTWFQERQRAQQQTEVAPNPLGLQLLLGSDSGVIFHNHLRNLQENRIRILEGLFERL